PFGAKFFFSAVAQAEKTTGETKFKISAKLVRSFVENIKILGNERLYRRFYFAFCVFNFSRSNTG
ncbi:MAG: hypothetical protein KDC75_27385, partial [Phaeodactylibacter sp.]|nr:hypothetical protein [Phaeodactylibacter sp.]